jgi:glycerol-3-phosphate O-acyltransferase / dihydroxyacetone phosphate acyltransferase
MSVAYAFVRGLLRWGLRAFFREIEVRGADNLPRDGPCIVAANHANSMLDPFLLLVALDRPLCFIAKAPLFRVPVLGWFLRRLRCIPAHRRQDAGYAKDLNEGLYAAAAETLAAGPALAIFPEGKSHSEPQLAEFRHGASKIALETEVLRGGVRLQLVGLHFEETRGFRGKVLIQLGPPIAASEYRGRYAADPREGTAALTADLQARLSDMILTAETQDVLHQADLLARMRATEEIGRAHRTEEAFDRKKLILDRYRLLRERAPREVEALRAGLDRYEGLLGRLGMREEQVSADYRVGPVLREAGLNTLLLALGLPVLAVGLAANLLPYLLSWAVSRVAGRLPDRRASAGFFAGLIAFPLFWAAIGWAVARRWGVPPALAAASLGPLSGALALQAMDRWHRILVQTGGLWMAVTRPTVRLHLRGLRKRLLAQADRLVESLAGGPLAR